MHSYVIVIQIAKVCHDQLNTVTCMAGHSIKGIAQVSMVYVKGLDRRHRFTVSVC